jgi:hypothetical protein
MNLFSSSPVWLRHYLGWLAAVAIILPGLFWAVSWLNQTYTVGAGWLALTFIVLMAGIVMHFYRLRRPQLQVCSTRPQVRPLQISCLAAQALGVQLLWLNESPEFATVLPWLAWSGWAYLCIIGGLVGLGWLSLFCSCRDEALLKGVGSKE